MHHADADADIEHAAALVRAFVIGGDGDSNGVADRRGAPDVARDVRADRDVLRDAGVGRDPERLPFDPAERRVHREREARGRRGIGRDLGIGRDAFVGVGGGGRDEDSKRGEEHGAHEHLLVHLEGHALTTRKAGSSVSASW